MEAARRTGRAEHFRPAECASDEVDQQRSILRDQVWRDRVIALRDRAYTTGLVLRLRHLVEAAMHFLDGYLFLLCENGPVVAKGIANGAFTASVKLVFHRKNDATASSNGALHKSVDVLDLQIDADG